jgi:hypothetical protein
VVVTGALLEDETGPVPEPVVDGVGDAGGADEDLAPTGTPGELGELPLATEWIAAEFATLLCPGSRTTNTVMKASTTAATVAARKTRRRQ